MDPSFALLKSIGGALVLLVVIVVAGWFAIARIRSWMRGGVEAEDAFSLDQLRKLHRSGQLSDEEFERAKATIIGAVRRETPAKREPIRSRTSDAIRAGRESTARTAGTGEVEAKSADKSAAKSPAQSAVQSPADSSEPRTTPVRPRALSNQADTPRPADGTHPTSPPKRPPQLG